MMTALMAWILKNQMTAKVTGGLATGTGMVALVFALHSDLKTEVAHADQSTMNYVDSQVRLLDQKVGNLEKGQGEIKDLLKVIDKRLYDLKTNK